jgi:hypothetical protein
MPAMAIDWQAMAGVSPDQLQGILLDEADRIMTGLTAEEEDRRLGDLAEPLRAIWLLSWLDFEVSQGSLLAYFFNSHGRHARLAVQALRAIGAHRMADVLAEAEQAYRSAQTEWEARRQELAGLGEQIAVRPYGGLPAAAELAELTDRYWQAAELDNWGDRLDRYLEEHVARLAGT